MIGIMLEKEWNISYITIRWLIEYIQLGDFAVPVIVVATVVHKLNRESLFKPIIVSHINQETLKIQPPPTADDHSLTVINLVNYNSYHLEYW